MNDKIFYILAIDGGGIRGVFAAQILKRIKEELKINFFEKFDIIAGTSTGSIIAAGLAVDYPIEKIVDLYQKKGNKIFFRNYSDQFNWKNWKSYFKSKYTNKYLKQELSTVFQDKTLSNTKTRLIIPASDISNGNVFVLKSNYDPNFVRDKDIRIADAVLASCSAPTYFDPYKINKYLLADGGLWANNPSLVALTEALGRGFKISRENIRIISIGTGIGKKYYNPKDVNKKWGLKQWGTGLVSTTMNLQSVNVTNIVRFLLDEDNFLRINFETNGGIALDDIDSIENLISRGDEKFTYYFEKIEKFLKEATHV
jgi:patatin-like phospholipase/acyl hydrolase